MFFWLKKMSKKQEIEEVAGSLSNLFARHLEVTKIGNSRQVQKAFQLVLAQAKGEKRKRGWHGSVIARLANSFGWKLVESGYPEDVALGLAKDLAMQLAQTGESKRSFNY